MRYTQAQVRDTVGIKAEKIRHWMTKLPPLKKRSGRGAVFTFGDLVALSIINKLVESFGVQVSMIGNQSDLIFETCNESSWLSLSGHIAVVGVTGASLKKASEIDQETLGDTSMMIPLDPILNHLQKRLYTEEERLIQQNLPFPPSVVEG